MGHGDLTTLSDLRALKRNLVGVGAPCSRAWSGGAGMATSSACTTPRERNRKDCLTDERGPTMTIVNRATALSTRIPPTKQENEPFHFATNKPLNI